MKNKLVILENSATLEDAYYVKEFKREYVGEVVELTLLHTYKASKIFAEFSDCTDIAVQTCFINGSDEQLFEMIELLSKIKHSINIYIGMVGSNNSLEEFLCDTLSIRNILSVKQHKIFELKSEYQSDEKETIAVSFDSVLTPYYKTHSKELAHNIYLEYYKETARNRPTGKKVKILACMAHGKAFEGLPIGEVVDVLECDKICKYTPRGVWVWGNGEPVMLVNDNGIQEYELQDVQNLTTQDILTEIGKLVSFDLTTLKLIEIEGLMVVIESDEYSCFEKANLICEEIGVEKRGNRANINNFLEKYLQVPII